MVLPGACAARGLTGFRMLDCAFGALAKMAPDRVCAASDGGNIGVAVGGYRADRSPGDELTPAQLVAVGRLQLLL